MHRVQHPLKRHCKKASPFLGQQPHHESNPNNKQGKNTHNTITTTLNVKVFTDLTKYTSLQ
jgi:hypothetical protein